MGKDFPNEIWSVILRLLQRSDWKQMRQSCRLLSLLITPMLFQTVYFELCGNGCASLLHIAKQPSLSKCVHTLVLRRVHRYFRFPDRDAIAESIFPTSEDSSKHTGQHRNVEDGGPVARFGGAFDSDAEKEAIYNEYELQRKQTQEQLRIITSQLRFHMPDFESLPVHPYRAWTRRAAAAPVHILSQALEGLPNLTIFRHEPGFLFDPSWGCRWHNLRFRPEADVYADEVDDEDVEALQLSIVLHTLAHVRKRNARMQSMSLYIGGPAFWGARRLQHLWDVASHERTRAYRDMCATAADADRFANSRYTDPERTRLHHWQLDLIQRDALASLTQLDCSVSEDNEWNGSLDTAQKYLCNIFLSHTPQLERLRLAFGRLAGGKLLPGEPDRLFARDTISLLARLTQRMQWPNLKSIELELATDATTLSGFVLAHKATLRSLSLTRMTLVLDECCRTWEQVIPDIIHQLSLQRLELAKLCDFAPQNDCKYVRRRMLFDLDAETWHGRSGQYRSLYHAVVGRLLRGEVTALM